MKVDSVGAGSQNNMTIDALKMQQNQAQQNDKVAHKPVAHKAPQDTVTISPEAAKAAGEAQKGGE
jgi:hypothetical protein